LASLAYLYGGRILGRVWVYTARQEHEPEEILQLRGMRLLRFEYTAEGTIKSYVTWRGKWIIWLTPTRRIVESMMDRGWPVPAEFFVGKLAREDLARFLVHERDFIRRTAKERMEELTSA